MRIVYSGLLYRCHARRVAACSAVVMRVEWRLIPPPCAWRPVCDCIRLMFLHGVGPCMQFQPEAALRNRDTGVYLIARVMASDEPLLSAESTKEMRCA